MSSPSRQARRVLLVLTLAQVFTFAGRQVVSVLIEPIKRDFAVGDTVLGLVAGLGYALLYGLLALPAGRLADRADRRRMIALSLLAWGVVTAACGFATGLLSLVLLRLLMALAEAGVTPPSLTLLPDFFPERRTKALGIFMAGSALGSLLALGVGSWTAAQFGWQRAFVVIGLPGALLAAVAAVFLSEPRAARTGPDVTDLASLPAALGGLLRDPAVRWLAIGAGAASFTTLAYITWLPAYLVRIHGMPLVRAGLLVALVGILSSLLGSLASGWVEGRLRALNPAWTLGAPTLGMTVAILAGLGVFGSPVSATFSIGTWLLPQALLWAALFGFASALWTPAVFACMSSLVVPERRALANGLLALANTWIGFGLGPFFVGLLSDALQPWSGDEALRLALAVTMCVGLAAPYAFVRVMRSGQPEVFVAPAAGHCPRNPSP